MIWGILRSHLRVWDGNSNRIARGIAVQSVVNLLAATGLYGLLSKAYLFMPKSCNICWIVRHHYGNFIPGSSGTEWWWFHLRWRLKSQSQTDCIWVHQNIVTTSMSGSTSNVVVVNSNESFHRFDQVCPSRTEGSFCGNGTLYTYMGVSWNRGTP